MTMREVAREAGVSVSTVSRVLNGGHLISAETIARVNDAMGRLKYRPNRIARSLRMTSTQTIAVLVSNVANPFFAELVRSIENEAAGLGLRLILANANESAERQSRYLETFLEYQIDGLIITPTGADASWLEEFQARRIPIVFVDRTIDGADIPSATTAHEHAVDELVQHLLALGHSRGAVLTGVRSNVPTRRRVDAFLTAARGRGLVIQDEHVLTGGVLLEQGRPALSHLLHDADRPDFLFTTNNVMGLAALMMFKELDITIPDDLGFASYDDTPWFSVQTPAVTAIAQAVTELGVAAADLLARMLAGKTVESVQIPATFVPRESCGKTHPSLPGTT